MKIIKDGRKTTRAIKPKRHTCVRCASVLEVSREDMGHVCSDRDGEYYTFRCPVCGHENYVDAKVVEAHR